MDEIHQLLGEKDLAIFFLQKKIKLLTEELEKIKKQIKTEETPHIPMPLPQND